MEPAKFVAFCPYRDEAIQKIDDYLNRQQELKNAAREYTELFNKLVTPGDPPEDRATLPTAYLYRGKPIPWYVLCCGWPKSAQQAADVLRDAGEIVEANGIYRELSRLPTEIMPSERVSEYHNVTREAALQVKAILTAITLAVPGELQAAHAANPPEAIPLPLALSSVAKPKPGAFRAYWLAQAGQSQQKIAEMLLGSKAKQGTISKWLGKVEEWKAAGNKMPEIPKTEPLDSKPVPMDPSRIDLGPRADHRPEHTRAKLAEISGHDWDKE